MYIKVLFTYYFSFVNMSLVLFCRPQNFKITWLLLLSPVAIHQRKKAKKSWLSLEMTFPRCLRVNSNSYGMENFEKIY